MLGIRTGSQRVNEAFLSGDRFELGCRDSKSNSSLPKDENFRSSNNGILSRSRIYLSSFLLPLLSAKFLRFFGSDSRPGMKRCCSLSREGYRIGWRLFDEGEEDKVEDGKIALFFFYAVALEPFTRFFFENSGGRLAVRHDCISLLPLSLSPLFWQSWPLSTAFRVVHTVLSTNSAFDRRKKKSRCARGVIAKWPLITSVGAALPISSKNRVSFLFPSPPPSPSSFFLSPNSVIYESANKR